MPPSEPAIGFASVWSKLRTRICDAPASALRRQGVIHRVKD
jgi:hypothetical protein